MNASVFKHISFENPGYFEDIFRNLNIQYRIQELYNGDDPEEGDPDLIVLMGGPMNIYEEDKYPWFREEKAYLKSCVEKGKVIIGVCLGAQLLADILGASIYKNTEDEIGWYTIQKTGSGFMDFLPDFATVLHWHGDTFTLPDGAKLLYSSEITENQAFLYDKNILGLQFHLEMTQNIISELADDSEILVKSRYVMDQEQIMAEFSKYSYSNQRILSHLVNYMLKSNNLLKT